MLEWWTFLESFLFSFHMLSYSVSVKVRHNLSYTSGEKLMRFIMCPHRGRISWQKSQVMTFHPSITLMETAVSANHKPYFTESKPPVSSVNHGYNTSGSFQCWGSDLWSSNLSEAHSENNTKYTVFPTWFCETAMGGPRSL